MATLLTCLFLENLIWFHSQIFLETVSDEIYIHFYHFHFQCPKLRNAETLSAITMGSVQTKAENSSVNVHQPGLAHNAVRLKVRMPVWTLNPGIYWISRSSWPEILCFGVSNWLHNQIQLQLWNNCRNCRIQFKDLVLMKSLNCIPVNYSPLCQESLLFFRLFRSRNGSTLFFFLTFFIFYFVTLYLVHSLCIFNVKWGKKVLFWVPR